jgi:hypothetical protein
MAIFAIATISRAWSGKTVKGWSKLVESIAADAFEHQGDFLDGRMGEV